MPCIARSEDGTIDRELCESISLHPIKNHQICNQKGLNCDSQYRICRVCAGQRWRMFGCSSAKMALKRPVALDEIRAMSSVSGLCYDHHMQAQEREPFTDRFPPKVTPKPTPATPTAVTRKRRGRKPRLVDLPEEEVIRDVCEELGGELPNVDFDPDEDLGVEPGYEVPKPPPTKNDLPVHSPAYQRAAARSREEEARPLPKLAGSPRARPVVIPPAPRPTPAPVQPPAPTPRPSLQRNPRLEELDNLRAFLAQPSSGGGVIVEGDDE